MKSVVERRTLWIFLFLNFLVWSLVPLLRHSLPMDTAEAIVWGKYSWLGTTKHPPLSGILAYPWFSLFGGMQIAMYILSQLCVVVGVIYIYKLAAKLLPEKTAILAALLQFGVIYYNFSSVEYNVNVVSIALWPINAYYFWQAYNDDKWRDWLVFGAVTALNLLNKYVAALQIVSFALFILSDKNIMRMLKNVKVYTAMAVCFLILAPHVCWMYENNFEPLNYIASRSGGGKLTTVWRHLIYPAKFIGAQLLFSMAGVITYLCFYMKNKLLGSRKKSWLNRLKNIFCLDRETENKKSLFIIITALTPLIVFAFISLISGNALKSMWGFPCLYMFGIALFYYLPWQLNDNKAKRFIKTMFVWSMLFACGYGVQCLLTASNRFTSDCPQIVKMLEQKWQENVPNKPLKYVGGNEWFVNMVNLYASHDIKPMVWLSPKNNPWLDKDDFEKSGALLVAEDLGAYRRMAEIYPVSEPSKITLEYHNYFGKTKMKDMFYGFYLPEENKNVE